LTVSNNFFSHLALHEFNGYSPSPSEPKAKYPPSTANSAPVIAEASLLHRKEMVAATSQFSLTEPTVHLSLGNGWLNVLPLAEN